MPTYVNKSIKAEVQSVCRNVLFHWNKNLDFNPILYNNNTFKKKKLHYCKNQIHLFSFVNITKMTQYQSLACEQSRIHILVVKLVPFLSNLNITA